MWTELEAFSRGASQGSNVISSTLIISCTLTEEETLQLNPDVSLIIGNFSAGECWRRP